MNIDIQVLNVSLSSSERQFIESAVERTFGTQSYGISLVEVRLSEHQNDDGNLHNRCLVWVELVNGTMLAGQSSDAELCYAIDRAIDQVKWKVSGKLQTMSKRSARRDMMAPHPIRSKISIGHSGRDQLTAA